MFRKPLLILVISMASAHISLSNAYAGCDSRVGANPDYASGKFDKNATSAAPAPVPTQTHNNSCPVPTLPSQFTITERIISWTTTFDIESGRLKLGVVSEKLISLTKSFRYVDGNRNLLAEARSRIFSWGTHIDVFDCQGKKLGSIKEQVLKSFFKVYTTYSILDANGQKVAESEKVDWISTDFALRDGQGRVTATLHRPWLNLLSDHWEGKIVNPAAIDPRLLVMIAAYKTSIDNDRRQEQDEEERRSRDDDNN